MMSKATEQLGRVQALSKKWRRIFKPILVMQAALVILSLFSQNYFTVAIALASVVGGYVLYRSSQSKWRVLMENWEKIIESETLAADTEDKEFFDG